MNLRFILSLGIATLMAAFSLTAQSTKPTASAGPTSKDTKVKEEFKISDDEKKVIELTNAERKKEGLEPLKANPLLFAAARKHTINMAKQDILEHKLDGKTPADRVKEEKYKYGMTGENVAMGYKTPTEVVEGWMKSPGHRKNILTKEYTEIGIGVARNSKGQLYWTQVFGKPLR